MAITATVVIPTWRRRDQLAVTLAAVADQDTNNFEIVVVSDGDDPAIRDLKETWRSTVPVTWIFHDDNRGLPAARNTGVAAARGDLLLFLDDDVVPAQSWLRHHVACHSSQAQPVIVLGNLTEEYDNVPESRLESVMRLARARGYRQFFDRAVRNGGSFEFAPHCGNNSSITAETFRRIGGFDENQRAIHEDLEIGERARALGVRFIYEPRAKAVHRNSRSAVSYESGLPRMAALSDINRVRAKGQRSERTAGPIQLDRGSFRARLRNRAAFSMPNASAVASSALVRAGVAIKSDRLFDTGRGLNRSVEYWNALKEAGEDRSSLKSLAGVAGSSLVVHSVSNEVFGEERRHHIRVETFRKSIELVAGSSYEVVNASAYVAQPSDRHRVVLTFDDAYEDFYTIAFPLLRSLGLSATVFVVAGAIGKTNEWDTRAGIRERRLMTRDQIREIHEHGIEVGSHSLTHARLTTVDAAALTAETVDSRKSLEDLLGSQVTAFAYPAGQVDERVRSAVARAGYTSAFTTIEGLNGWTDPLLLHRASLSESDSSFSVRLKLRTGRGVGGHGRRMLIAAAKASVSVLPKSIARRTSDVIRKTDSRTRSAMWERRSAQLARDSIKERELPD